MQSLLILIFYNFYLYTIRDINNKTITLVNVPSQMELLGWIRENMYHFSKN